MTTSHETPYKILGVAVDIDYVTLRTVYRQAIHDCKQGKISDEDFRQKIRAYETLSDFEKRNLYDTRQEWISDLPLTKYTVQQLAAEPSLVLILHDRLRDANLSSINAQDSNTGHTALYCAARAGNIRGVQFLTEHGAEPDLSQRTKSTALHAASFFGHADVVRCLLESGADYRIENEGKRAAEMEAFNNEVRKVFSELKQEPYVRAAANELEWFKNNVLKQHIDTQYFSQRQTLLHCASKKGYLELVKLLIEKLSADLNIVDVNGNSALHLAAYGGHEKIVDYLLTRGCDSTLENQWGLTAQQEGIKHGDRMSQIFQSIRNWDMFEMARKGNDWWFKYYYETKSPDAADSNGVSLLYHASRNNQYFVVKWLLDHHANINIKLGQSPKSTPLHGAKYHGHFKTVELLLEHGADVTIKNDFRANVFEDPFYKDIDSNTQNRINELLSKHRNNLTGHKLMDVYIYLDQDTGDEPQSKLQLQLNAGYQQLVEALPNALKNKLGYFSIAKRRLFFEKNDTTIISAVCRARYANSKFVETPIRLTLHEDSSKKIVTPQYARSDPKFDYRAFTRMFSENAQSVSYQLKPSDQKQIIKIENLQFTFSESTIKQNVTLRIATIALSALQLFAIPGCLYLFEITPSTETFDSLELPLVSVVNNQDACLYTLATPIAYWFRSNTRRTRVPMFDGFHAFIQHVNVIPILLTLPSDMVLAACLDKPLVKREKPVKCTCLVLQEHDTANFANIAYHGTSIAVVRSILTDGLVAPGTVVTTGKRIMPPTTHIPRGRSAFDISDFADAIFLSPSVHYSSDPCYAIPFSHDDQQLIPVLECGVKKDSYSVFPCTVSTYIAQPDDNKNAIEWRLQNPEFVVVNCVLFIPKAKSIEATAYERLKKIK